MKEWLEHLSLLIELQEISDQRKEEIEAKLKQVEEQLNKLEGDMD